MLYKALSECMHIKLSFRQPALESFLSSNQFLVAQGSLAYGVINTMRPRQNGRHFTVTFSNAFPWIKMYEFRLKLHWSLFPRVHLRIFQHYFRIWLGTFQATTHYLNQWWLVHWRIYASLGLNELIHHGWLMHISINLVINWFRQWFVTCSTPSHYLIQCWLTDVGTLGNKIQWSLN